MEVEKASEKTHIKEKEEEKTQGEDSVLNGSILSEELGASAYTDKKIKIQSYYLQNLSSKLSLKFDGWTSPNNEPILGISGTNLNRFYLISNIINNFIFSKRIL